MDGWSKTDADLETIQGWEKVVVSGKKKTPGRRHQSTGIRTGELTAIDVDVNDEKAADEIVRQVKEKIPGLLERLSKHPRRLLLGSQPNPHRKQRHVYLDQDGNEQVLELLGQGQMFIAYGKHPSGVDYRWNGSGNPVDVDSFDLPDIDIDVVVAIFHEVCLAAGWTLKSESGGGASGGSGLDFADYVPEAGFDLEKLRDVLRQLDPLKYPELDTYEEWMAVGMAIHKETDGSAEGFALFDKWSARGENYGGSEVVEKFWNDFKPIKASGWSLIKRIKDRGGEVPGGDETDEEAELSAAQEVQRLIQVFKECDSVEGLNAAAKEVMRLQTVNREEMIVSYQETYKRLMGQKCPIKVARAKLTPSVDDLQELAANAVLAHYNPKHLIYTGKQFWAYSGGIWGPVSDAAVLQIVYPILGRHADRSKNLAESVMHQVKAAVNQDGFLFDQGDKFDLYFSNCIVNISSEGVISTRKHQHEDYCTAQIPHNYTPGAEAPRFTAFLREVFEDDFDRCAKGQLMAEMIGYTMTRSTMFEKYIVLVGYGANGKSVIMSLLDKLLGDDNTCAIALEKMGRSFDKNHLMNRLANIVPELSVGAILPDAEIKSLVSGDKTTTDGKFGSHMSWTNFATLWFSCNTTPHTKDTSDGMLRRTTIVEFNRNFKGKEDDKHLREKLYKEIPGVINYCLAALCEAVKRGDIIEPSSCAVIKEEWRLSEDTAADFIDKMCILDPDARIPKNELYEYYREWCDMGGNYMLTKINFGKKIASLGIKDSKSGPTRYRIGVRLKTKQEQLQ